jgi:hypothetical protein
VVAGLGALGAKGRALGAAVGFQLQISFEVANMYILAFFSILAGPSFSFLCSPHPVLSFLLGLSAWLFRMSGCSSAAGGTAGGGLLVVAHSGFHSAQHLARIVVSGFAFTRSRDLDLEALAFRPARL